MSVRDTSDYSLEISCVLGAGQGKARSDPQGLVERAVQVWVGQGTGCQR
jgi:hypothetical protein